MMFCKPMKLLTLNTHSLIEEKQAEKMKIVADAINKEKIDVIALQEVNQPKDGAVCDSDVMSCQLPVKRGNYMDELMKLLHSREYKGVWYGFKESYGEFEEGVGIISRFPIEDVCFFKLTSGQEKMLWKARGALGIKTEYGDFFCTHMGWWNDADEPFLEQWNRLKSAVKNKKTWIMGDFNAESHATGEGYDLIRESGFFDSFHLAKSRKGDYTVIDKIDGWDSESRKRIDYVFCNFPADVRYSATIFDGNNYNRVSDHFGVMIETEV